MGDGQRWGRIGPGQDDRLACPKQAHRMTDKMKRVDAACSNDDCIAPISNLPWPGWRLETMDRLQGGDITYSDIVEWSSVQLPFGPDRW